MRRFFLPEVFQKESTVTLKDPNEIHHLKNVLRLNVNKMIEVFNHDQIQAKAQIIEILPSKVTLKIVEILPLKTNNQRQLILACAIPKKSKFETIIEKTTELGVSEIIPLRTKRTEMMLEGERLNRKKERYELVAINAAKQSQRIDIPLIRDITPFQEAVDSLLTRSTIIIPSLVGDRIPIKQALEKIPASQPIAFLIGPEGDFTKEEYQYAKTHGCVGVTLGETTLKVETAAISVIAFAKLYSI